MKHWNEAHTDVPLSEYSLAYKNEGFIADLVCPRVGVGKSSDKYYIYNTEDLKYVDTLRAPKTASKGIRRTLSTDTYYCNQHSLHEMVDDLDVEDTDDAIDPEMDAVDGVMELMNISLEKEVADMMRLTTNYHASNSATLTGSNQWSDYGGTSDPLGDIRTGQKRVFAGSLKRANAIILPYDVACALADHPDVVERYKFIKETLNDEINLPPVFRGMRVFVAVSAYDTTRQGQSGSSFTAMWGRDVILFHLAPTFGRKTMAFAKNFSRGGASSGRFVNRIPQPDLGNNTRKIEVVDRGRDPKIVSNVGGYVIKTAIAA